MPLLSRRRTILAKIESTYGTDSVPTGSANAILVRNMTITPLNADMVSRDLVRPYLGTSEQLIAARHVAIEFEVEMAGSGTAGTAPAYGPLLRACGLSQTLTASTQAAYSPVSSGIESVTLYHNVDGVLHRITGARGNATFNINARAIPTIQFQMTGIYNAPSDAALPTVDYSAFQTPLASNTANTTGFSFFSFSGVLESLSLTLGNTVNYRSLIGSESVLITDRAVSGTAVFEAPLTAQKDFFAAALLSTLGNLSITQGTVAGNKFKIDSSRVDIANPTYTDNDGIHMLSVPFVCVPSSAGNDEVSITVL
jgi:hypothetical protein